MKIAERVLERRMRALVNLNKIQFGFMPGKGTIDAIFIVRRMQEEYQRRTRSCICVLLTWKELLIECQEK